MAIRIRDERTEDLWDAHVKYWDGCSRCPLANFGTNYVFARGSLPCDILFIGEAPGRDEDKEGEPFVGRSGKLLEKILKKITVPFRYAITNTVLCIPLKEFGENYDTIRPPEKDEIETCSTRLKEFITMASPKGIVFLGKVAADNCWAAARTFVPGNKILKVWHPSYVVRNGGVGSSQFDTVVGQLDYFIKEAMK
jgi:DNA polymerase